MDEKNAPHTKVTRDQSGQEPKTNLWPTSSGGLQGCVLPATEGQPDKQRLIDVSNLRFYGRMFEEYKWQTDVLHWTVFVQTLNEIASRIEASKPTLPATGEDLPPLDVTEAERDKAITYCSLGKSESRFPHTEVISLMSTLLCRERQLAELRAENERLRNANVR